MPFVEAALVPLSRLFFYPGASIGNSTPEEALALLHHAGFTPVRQWTDASDYFGLFAADA